MLAKRPYRPSPSKPAVLPLKESGEQNDVVHAQSEGGGTSSKKLSAYYASWALGDCGGGDGGESPGVGGVSRGRQR